MDCCSDATLELCTGKSIKFANIKDLLGMSALIFF